MAATVNLVLGLVGAGKSARLLERYREVVSQKIGSAVWIAPTERVRDEILESLARTSGAVLAPRVVTFPELAAQLAGPIVPNRILPEPHQRMLLDELLAELRAKKALPFFGRLIERRGVVDAIYSFISELKGRGISPAGFDECATRANEQHGAGLRRKDAEIALICARYVLLFGQKRWLDRESQYALAIERLQRDDRLLNASAVFIDGFVIFTPPQLKLLRGLRNEVSELWLTLPYDVSRPEMNSPAGATLAELEHTLPNSRRIEMPAPTQGRRPAGLERVTSRLFQSNPAKSSDATGLSIIHAPGLLGEVRMAARAVKQLLLDGVNPSLVLVSARNLSTHAGLLPEVFAEYGIPLDIESGESLGQQPIVATLLSAAELPETDWPFATTTALLRSTFFRPDWPEVAGETAEDAEITLRLLGEPRGRDNYLTAARKCAEAPETPMEDEEAAGSALRRKHELAKSSLPLLEKFFSAWDDAPASAPFADHALWLKTFADRLGFTKDEKDAQALARLWHELDRWSARQAQQHKQPPAISRGEFLHSVGSLAASVHVGEEESRSGRVRAVPAELVPGLKYDHLFLLGLGEGSFPNLSGEGLLYDEAERRAFREAGLDLALTEDRLAREMLLFHRLLGAARKSVTLSFAAVDEKGQDQLPGTFLQNVQELFDQGALKPIERKLLVDGIESQRTYSPAEYRVRYASAEGDAKVLAEGVADHLTLARSVADHRFKGKEFGPFDGLMSDSGIRAEITKQFGASKVFSASALDDYIACPFKFLFGRVLRLEPLDDPAESIEAARRGAVLHRALARLHRRPAHQISDVARALTVEIDRAVAEEAERAGSAAAKALWQLEGERLRRTALRYQNHWEAFRGKWAEAGLDLLPTQVEKAFALDFEEVRLTGRIDRIDTATLPDGSQGFLVIDYKTGSAPSLTAAAGLESLQLAVYSLAAERDLGRARPLGFAYWKFGETGASIHPRKKGGWLDTPKTWEEMRATLIQWLGVLASHIRAGEFPLKPRHPKSTCDNCDFRRTCRISQSRPEEKAWELPLPMAGGDS